MTVVVLGLTAALLFGVSDFFGAVASRSQPATRIAFGALLVCAVVVLPALAIVPSVWSAQAVVFGGLAGLTAGVGLLLLYAALAAGPIGFVAPTVALMCAVLPALWAFGAGERIPAAAIAALAAVVAGGVLIGVEPDEGLRPRPRTLLLTLVTGLVYAAYFVLMDATPEDSGAVPMVADTVVAAAAVGAILLVVARRGGARAARPGRGPLLAALGAGLTQGVATVLLVLGLHLPGLAIVSALSALYPVTTVGLAVLVLRERLRLHQLAGLLIAIAGVAALALSRA